MRKRKKDFNYVSGKKYDGMMGRCYRPSESSYESYGGRGIKVCSSWIKDINTFRTWVSDQLYYLKVSIDEFTANPKKYSLDRIDSNGHYAPENCRLVSSQEQSRNISKRNKKIYVSSEGEKIYV
jgi:hypothetical protein